MKAVIRYAAMDGVEFENESDCVAHEEMIGRVERIMSLLKKTPTELNWQGYVQQDPVTLKTVRTRLFEIANQPGVLKRWIDSQKNDHGRTEMELIDIHPSWFRRMLDGSCPPLDRAYSRMCAIDSEGREWNQPYYALNPGRGELIERSV